MENIISQIQQVVSKLVSEQRQSEALFFLEKICVSSLMQLGLMNHQVSNDFFPASKFLEMALAIDPGDWEAYHNLSHVYNASEKLNEAKAACENAIRCAPENSNPWYNYGVVLSALKYSKESIESYRTSLSLNPESGLTKYNLGCELLKNGEFEEGWPFYDARLEINSGIKAIRNRFKCPDWKGQKVDRLIVYCEQGMGDTIQFGRFLPRLKEVCSTIYFEAQAALAPFYSDITNVIPRKDGEWPTPPEADAVISVCSLAKIFNYKPDDWFEKLPIPPADFMKISSDKIKVGLVWSGNPLHPLDHTRSIPVNKFGELVSDNLELYSFQKQIVDLRKWKNSWVNLQQGVYSIPMTDLSPKLNTMVDTAHLLTQMDVLITVDTSVAHLAGAIGVKTWLLVPYASDWRWMENRTDSPWYPSMKIFRQGEDRDWDKVIKSVSDELASLKSPQS